MRLSDEGGKIAKFVPVGLWVIGANGRLNPFAEKGQFVIVDRSNTDPLGDGTSASTPGERAPVEIHALAGRPMNALPAMEAAYSELASSLDRAKERASTSGDMLDMERVEGKQRINDPAYFILARGQLEAEINRVAEAAVRARRASSRWNERRARDAHDPDNMRAKFEDRAALVPDRFNTTFDAYRRTIRCYGWRNAIAHGTNLATGIDVASTVLDLYPIASEIAP